MQIKQAAETERLDKQLAADEKKMDTDAAQRKKDADDQLKQVQADKEKQDEANKAAEAAIMVKKAKENGQKKIRKGKEKMKEKIAETATPGMARGRQILRMIVNCDAPSSRAASSRS